MGFFSAFSVDITGGSLEEHVCGVWPVFISRWPRYHSRTVSFTFSSIMGSWSVVVELIIKKREKGEGKKGEKKGEKEKKRRKKKEERKEEEREKRDRRNILVIM